MAEDVGVKQRWIDPEPWVLNTIIETWQPVFPKIYHNFFVPALTFIRDVFATLRARDFWVSYAASSLAARIVERVAPFLKR